MMGEPQVQGFRLRIDFAQASDPGRDPNKQVNEDSCGYSETRLGHLMVLCDGMGGHYGGKEASRCAITTIFEVFEQQPANANPAAVLKGAIEEAGRRVYQLGGPPENRARPGSTVVAMLLHDRGVDVAHVGDSRAYVIRANQIYPLTRDHSMVQGMIDAGMLTEEQAMGHPDSNKITRALGMKPEVEVEVRPEPMELFAGDVLLQSSDGLTDLALGKDILGATRQALASGPVAHACDMLVQMANNRGGHDNITVQMVRIAEVGVRSHLTIPGGPTQLAGAGVPSMRGPQVPHAGAPVPETVQMTSPDGQRAPYPQHQQHQQQAHPQQHAAAAPASQPMQWAPVMPTAADPAATLALAPGAAYGLLQHAAQGPGPTMDEMPAQQAQGAHNAGWGGGMHAPPQQSALTPTAPAGPVAFGAPPPAVAAPPLAGYRIDSPQNALQLPPTRGYGGPSPTQVPYGAPSGAPMGMAPGGMPSPFAHMPHAMGPQVQPSKGGIVFVIIGISAMIAVLIIVLLWVLLK